MTGTWRTVRLHLRTGWLPLLAWPLVMAGVVMATASSITALYPDEASRAAYAAGIELTTVSNAFNGRGYDLATTGGIVANELGFMGQLMIPIVALTLALGRTRRQEDAGRLDLLTAAPIGRLAPLAGASVVTAASLAGFGLLTWAGLAGAGLPPDRAGTYAGSLSLLALGGASLGFLMGELARDARTATSLGLAAILGSYLLRALIDGSDWAATWATPHGWLAEVRPWGEDGQWWPLAAYGGLAALAWAVAAVVGLRRDLGSGALAPLPGPERGGAFLARATGQALRLTCGSFLGCTAGLVVWGGVIGLISEQMMSLAEASPTILAMLGVERADQLMTLMSTVVTAIGALALGLQAIGILAGEEESGRLGLVLSAPVRRARVWGAWLAVVALEVSVALVASNLALEVSTELATGTAGAVADSLEASAAHLVAVLAVVAWAAALRAFTPPAWPAAWGLLAWVTVVALLADALDLPAWSRNLSPIELVGRVPVDPVNGSAMAWLGAAGVVMAVASALAFGRRDLRSG